MTCSNPSSRARSWWPIPRLRAHPTRLWRPFCIDGRGERLGIHQEVCRPGGHFTKSGAAPAKFVGQGEAAVCIVFSHDIVNEVDNNKMPLELTFPKEGTGYEIGGMGILKGAKHPDAAKIWFDWALTPEAQDLGPKYKAYQAPTSRAWSFNTELLQVKLIKYNFHWAGNNKKEIVDKFTNELAAADKLK